MRALFLLVIFALTGLVFALEDKSENRELQAKRYLEANPPKAIIEALAERTASSLPEAERKPYTEMLTKYLDLSVITQAMQVSLVKYFTADELKVLADFYSMPAAKSAMGKMDNYLTDILPVVQAEMLKAQQQAFNPHQQHLENVETMNKAKVP